MSIPESVAQIDELVKRAREPWTPTEGKREILCGLLAAALEAQAARVKELEALCERLKLEVQIHSGEARAHKSTVHECYQAASGATGEPGNWHGATPVRDRIAALEAELDIANKQIAETGRAWTADREKLEAQLEAFREAARGISKAPAEHREFRLQDEGKPYQRSSCDACGRGITTGLGKRCHFESENLTAIIAERDSLRKALDDRWEADKKAAKAIFAETGRTHGFPSVKEVVAYYMAEVERLRQACSTENDDICQTLGKALGYPWFKDDQKTFPGTTEDNGVCVGDHVAASIAADAPAQKTQSFSQLCNDKGAVEDYLRSRKEPAQQSEQEYEAECIRIDEYNRRTGDRAPYPLTPAQKTREVQLKPGWLIDDVRKAAARLEPTQQTQRDIRDMLDGELALYLAGLEKRWDDLMASLEESGGCSGSPGEWLAEEMGAARAEQKRRAQQTQISDEADNAR